MQKSSTSKKKLCFLSRSDLTSSPYAEIALPALAQDKWEITVIAPGASNSILRAVKPFPCKTHDLSLCNPLMNELEMFKSLLSARFGDFDVIYINSQSLSARALFALLGPRFGKRVVYHNPDFYDPFNHPIYFCLDKYFSRSADLFINNEFHRGYITKSLYKLRCPIITAPPNLPSYWPVATRSTDRRSEICGGNDADCFVLMLHGSFAEIRMVPELFRALNKLPPRFRLVMTGVDHRKEEVESLLKQLGIADRVLRLGRLGFNELLEYTVNADAGVLLYQNNDLGNFFTAPGRLTEYLSCGLPVIASNHTGLENLVLRYGLGQTVDSTDPNSIAEGILKLEESTKEGIYSESFMKAAFVAHFAFDNWEPLIVESFNNLLRSDYLNNSNGPVYPWLPKP